MRLIRALLGRPVAQRAALQEIPVVQQQGIGAFGPGVINQMRQIRQAEPFLMAVCVIVPAKGMGVQIRRGKQPQDCLEGGHIRHPLKGVNHGADPQHRICNA